MRQLLRKGATDAPHQLRGSSGLVALRSAKEALPARRYNPEKKKRPRQEPTRIDQQQIYAQFRRFNAKTALDLLGVGPQHRGTGDPWDGFREKRAKTEGTLAFPENRKTLW